MASVTEIRPSANEILAGRLSPQNVEKALVAMYRDGIVVLAGIVDFGHLDHLNGVMVEDAQTLYHRKDSTGNYHKDNIQQDPPVRDELFYNDVFLNPLAIQVSSAYLGPRPKMTFLSGNTAMPRSNRSQPVHTDADFTHPSIPFAVVVNVPLISMSLKNGSTELWLGTHTYHEDPPKAYEDGIIPPELVDKRLEARPPIQPEVSRGSIILRDLRLWHCGKPNNSDDIRVMLAMIHFAPWYRNQMTIQLPRGGSVQERVQCIDRDLEIPAEWVDRVDHIENVKHGNAYDFTQSS